MRSLCNAIALLALLLYSSLQKNLAMNAKIHAEVQQLKIYLQKYPQQAIQLAVNHLKDYLILLNECQRLKDQIELFNPLLSFSERDPDGERITAIS